MKISIITATWNSGATLRDTMESVLSQTYPDIEHIIVDGGSLDNTMEIVRELEPQYHGRLRYVSEQDKGLYDAMNKGLKMATGDIVGILNSDDFYTNEKVLEKVSKALDNKIIDAVYGDIHFVHDNDLKRCVRYYSSRTFRRSWMRLGFMPAHPVSIVVKLYMTNMEALICLIRLPPILNVFYGLFSYIKYGQHISRWIL